jgi:hypothetical protein
MTVGGRQCISVGKAAASLSTGREVFCRGSR